MSLAVFFLGAGEAIASYACCFKAAISKVGVSAGVDADWTGADPELC